MSVDRWVDKEAVVHIYNGTLLSHIKECIWVSSNEVGESRAYYTEWSKSEKEKQILYINMYIWHLERWYWWTYLQGSNGDSDRTDLWTQGWGEAEGRTNVESSMEHTHYLCKIDKPVGICYITQGAQTRALWQPRGVRWGGWWEGGSRGRGHMYTYGWFKLMHGKNQNILVKQLSFNEK